MSYQDPPPGPYGGGPQQPGQPGPYGGPSPSQPPPNQPGPSPYGSPYGSPYAPGGQVPGGGVPGQPGYGYPQQGFGTPQQPGPPGPYGQPYPPPPQRGGKGKTVGIVVGALVVVGAVIGGVVAFTGGDEGTDAGKVAPYRIVPPETVLDGTYREDDEANDGSDGMVSDADAEKLGVDNGEGVTVSYQSDSDGDLRLAGVHGEISDPRKSADAMFALVHKSQDDLKGEIDNYRVETVGERKEYSPDGFDGAVLECETQRQSGEIYGTSLDVEFSTCVWSDSSAVAAVSHSGAQSSDGTFGKSMSRDALAEATVKVREDTRKEIEEK